MELFVHAVQYVLPTLNQIVAKQSHLHRVEVCRHHNGNYRVNLWEQPESMVGFAVAIGARIRSSYYLKVSDTGEIIHSNPPLINLGSSN